MKNKLYLLKASFKNMYKTHYFLYLGNRTVGCGIRFNTKHFVNITSGTIVSDVMWDIGSDIEEVEPTKEQKELIKKVLNKKRTKDFITRYKV